MAKKARPRTLYQAFSDLVKTVKVDAPTRLLGKSKPAGSPRRGYLPSRAAPAAQRLNPGVPPSRASSPNALQRHLPAIKPRAKGIRPMKSKKTTGSSHRPLAAVLIAIILFAGGAFTYRSMQMPKVHVKKVATQWLDQTAGKPRPRTLRHHTRHPHPIIVRNVKQKKAQRTKPVLAKHKRIKKRAQATLVRKNAAPSHVRQVSYHTGD